jgi:Phosphoesterase family
LGSASLINKNRPPLDFILVIVSPDKEFFFRSGPARKSQKAFASNKHDVQRLFIELLQLQGSFSTCRQRPAHNDNQEAGPVSKVAIRSCWAILFLICISFPKPSKAQNGLQKVNHIIVVMQENHSFDNYFGALSYAPGSSYHHPSGTGGCDPDDHACVDGLTCMLDATGTPHCFNSNLDDNGSQVFAFHEPSRCVLPDLNHGWFSTHREANYLNPQNTLG